ncbi:hypothetical protein CcCBS67573_g07658 [Chytriomyces confervae]|uniref:polynucleotide adenylyltransferase n=1 Tax=Chytriomyces confervae TaxID=246404 RepID=A0A507EST8_9FUNG|nr:hypothetical protein CcCBS67573_g07658 [Chytriomyces confervae]
MHSATSATGSDDTDYADLPSFTRLALTHPSNLSSEETSNSYSGDKRSANPSLQPIPFTANPLRRRTLSDALPPHVHVPIQNSLMHNIHTEPLHPASHVRRTGSLADFGPLDLKHLKNKHVMQQQQSRLKPNFKLMHACYPGDSSGDVADEAGTVFYFDEDDEDRVGERAAEFVDTGGASKRTPSFDGTSSGESNTWVGSFTDQPSSLSSRNYTLRNSFDDKWKSPTGIMSIGILNLQGDEGNAVGRDDGVGKTLISPSFSEIQAPANVRSNSARMHATSPMISPCPRSTFEARLPSNSAQNGNSSNRLDPRGMGWMQHDAGGFKLPPTFSMDTSQHRGGDANSPGQNRSPSRAFSNASESSPLFLPHQADSKNIWGAPDLNMGVSVFTPTDANHANRRNDGLANKDAARLVPSVLLRRNASFDHGAERTAKSTLIATGDTIQHTTAAAAVAPLAASKTKLNPLVSPFEYHPSSETSTWSQYSHASTQSSHYASNQSSQYTSPSFNANQYATNQSYHYHHQQQQQQQSPSLSFRLPDQLYHEQSTYAYNGHLKSATSYNSLTTTEWPQFSYPITSPHLNGVAVPASTRLMRESVISVSPAPAAPIASDLRIVKEIKTSKLRVDESKLTTEYFEQLSRESAELCCAIVPSSEERVRQEVAFRSVLEVARRAFPDASLHHFGSTALGFSLANAGDDFLGKGHTLLEIFVRILTHLKMKDMDLSISLGSNAYDAYTPAQLVEKLGIVMKNAGMRDVKMLTRARVPIVKIRDAITGIRCDIGFQSKLVLYNTRLLKAYSRIDPRFRELVFIVKYWSKQRNINEPYFGTLSSYCFVLMVIHFLQIRGVLPCLQQIAHDGQNVPNIAIDEANVYFCEDVDTLVSSGKWTCTNAETVGELVVAFFKYFSAEFPYVHGVASVRTGSVLSKEDKGWTKDRQQEMNRSVEDPFETTNNVGRPVDKETLFEVRGEFIRASKILCSAGGVGTGAAYEAILSKVCERAPVIISKKGTAAAASMGGSGSSNNLLGMSRKW